MYIFRFLGRLHSTALPPPSSTLGPDGDLAVAAHARVAQPRLGGLRRPGAGLLALGFLLSAGWPQRRGHRSGGRVGDLVDVAGSQGVAQAGAAGLQEDCCWAVEAEEELRFGVSGRFWAKLGLKRKGACVDW